MNQSTMPCQKEQSLVRSKKTDIFTKKVSKSSLGCLLQEKQKLQAYSRNTEDAGCAVENFTRQTQQPGSCCIAFSGEFED